MAISLAKGQKVDLTKGNAGLTDLLVGLGWDPIQKPGRKGGFFSSLFGGGGESHEIDCDASVLMLDASGKLSRKEHVVYFGNLQSPCGSIRHMGDNLTGVGDGDDEQILVQLNRVPQEVQRLVFVVNIYDCQRRKQDFGMIENAFIRVVNGGSRQEMLRYDLQENYADRTALITGEVYRYQGEWKFAAIGEATNDGTLSELIRSYL